MAKAQLFVSKDEFTCSFCLDTLTDPVTILCGHSFCLKCLTDYWDQSQVYRCPKCRHTFTTRPELNRNTLLYEVIKKLKKTALSPPPSQNYAGPGDVECDFCTGKKFRVVKSCITCPASYCQTHLQLHFEGVAWKGHKLVDSDRNLKEKLCVKHQKCLEIFCKTDETCICVMCVVTGHKNHEIVELEKEREEKEKQLGATLSDIKRRLEEREKTLKQTRRAMEEMKISVEREMRENKKSFTALMRCIEEAYRKLTERIREQEPLTVDINTAHRYLHLSEGNKKVTRKWTEAKYPDHPDRFDYWPQVLCREALTGTRCYWEVECTGVELVIGVAYKGLSRKGKSKECSLGNNYKSWSLLWSLSQYFVCHYNKRTEISAPYSPRIGVYLDWPAGSLSFYSVSHTMTLLHRFNTSFTEPLYPGFYLGLHCSVTISHLTA
ncbi:tripartite motif-containing protein 16-like protein [Polypterus senegalus]|uniref:tripartite motif-containing protein 16-like protein n=1 Tax=Polypterus senegalus TaxID=55291 RepID=UPI0019655F0E|nr:tripartite motif-containing protein 16-like protein [Polypterus senegalus]